MLGTAATVTVEDVGGGGGGGPFGGARAGDAAACGSCGGACTGREGAAVEAFAFSTGGGCDGGGATNEIFLPAAGAVGAAAGRGLAAAVAAAVGATATKRPLAAVGGTVGGRAGGASAGRAGGCDPKSGFGPDGRPSVDTLAAEEFAAVEVVGAALVLGAAGCDCEQRYELQTQGQRGVRRGVVHARTDVRDKPWRRCADASCRRAWSWRRAHRLRARSECTMAELNVPRICFESDYESATRRVLTNKTTQNSLLTFLPSMSASTEPG
jgi:hypothetical protein